MSMSKSPLDKISEKFAAAKGSLSSEMLIVPAAAVLAVAAVSSVLAQKISDDELKQVQVVNHENSWAVYATEQRVFRRYAPLTVKVARPSSQTRSYEEFRTLVQSDLAEWNRALQGVGSGVSFISDPGQFPVELCFDKSLLLPENEVRICLYDPTIFKRWREGRPHHHLITDVGASTDEWHTVRSGANVAVQDGGYSVDFLQRVVLHELGHVLGFADLESPTNVGSIMRAYSDHLPLQIDEGTLEGLGYLYGSQKP